MNIISFGIPKVLVVILLLIAANVVWSYIKRLRRRAEQNANTNPGNARQKSKKPKDDQLGEYVDYEELKDE